MDKIMKEPIIFQKSPLVQPTKPGIYFYCACGASTTQPFCDGSHKGTGFVPKKVEVTEERTMAWCGCRRSKNLPLCDGTHRGL
jgi:CDGSH-type Zn-finger protein